jgi:glycosyltransferase involved in cell wall biosynthesis
MRVGWLQDDPGYIGGAEMTAAEFRAAVPDGVEIVDCPAGAVEAGLDRYVLMNCVRYPVTDIWGIDAPIFKYWHDVWPHSVDPRTKIELLDRANHIFCSPLHRKKMTTEGNLDGEVIPPAMDVSDFKPPRQSRKRREGACSIAQWRNPGKGAQYVEDYARTNRPVDVYGPGPFQPRGLNVKYMGPLEADKVRQTLWDYDVYVFLPFELEPFCRSVVEAHAAKCDLVINGLIGCRHYLENDPDALKTAGKDFWELVLG